MRGLLDAAGLRDARPSEVGRTLGLDKSLAWKVARFVKDEDPSRAARHMPGTGGVDIVLRAAAARGVGEAPVAAVRTAGRRLHEFVERHAGDRRSFEAMLAGGVGADGQVDLEVRRAAYRAGSAAWGVRAGLQLLTIAIRPSADRPGMLDFVSVSGLVDLERLRTDVPWIIRRFWVHDDSGERVHQVHREPLDPAGAEGSVMPLMGRYCSHPPPAVRRFEGSGGMVYDELVEGPVGRRAAVSCILGERYIAAASSERSPENRWAVYPLVVRTPVEQVQFDLLLHPELEHFGPARMMVRGLLEDRPRPAIGSVASVEGDTVEAPRIPAPGTPRSAAMPRYEELIREALDRAGWESPETFRGFRADVAYPLTPSEVTLMCEIRDR
jgi:hypothetical protein